MTIQIKSQNTTSFTTRKLTIYFEGNGLGKVGESQSHAGDRQPGTTAGPRTTTAGPRATTAGSRASEGPEGGQGADEGSEGQGHSEGRRRRRSAGEGNHGNSNYCILFQ